MVRGRSSRMQSESPQYYPRPPSAESLERSLKYRLVANITPARWVEDTDARPSRGAFKDSDAVRQPIPRRRISPTNLAVLKSGMAQLNGRKTGFTGRPTRCASTPSSSARA